MSSIVEYARRVRVERARQGVGQRELAKKAGTTASTVSRFENGKETTFGVVLALMEALGLPVFDATACDHEYVCRFCGDELTTS